MVSAMVSFRGAKWISPPSPTVSSQGIPCHVSVPDTGWFCAPEIPGQLIAPSEAVSPLRPSGNLFLRDPMNRLTTKQLGLQESACFTHRKPFKGIATDPKLQGSTHAQTYARRNGVSGKFQLAILQINTEPKPVSFHSNYLMSRSFSATMWVCLPQKQTQHMCSKHKSRHEQASPRFEARAEKRQAPQGFWKGDARQTLIKAEAQGQALQGRQRDALPELTVWVYHVFRLVPL